MKVARTYSRCTKICNTMAFPTFCPIRRSSCGVRPTWPSMGVGIVISELGMFSDSTLIRSFTSESQVLHNFVHLLNQRSFRTSFPWLRFRCAGSCLLGPREASEVSLPRDNTTDRIGTSKDLVAKGADNITWACRARPPGEESQSAVTQRFLDVCICASPFCWPAASAASSAPARQEAVP